MSNELQNEYVIDGLNRIVSVGCQWDRFALENNGRDSLAAIVVGQSVWNFVAGVPTREILEFLFRSCRSQGENISLNYRCDSALMQRHFEMTIIPLSQDRLRITHDLQFMDVAKGGPRDVQYVSSGGSERCSICNNVHLSDRWVDLFQQKAGCTQVSNYIVCPHCQGNALRMLA